MRLWSRMSDWSFEELIPLISARYSGPSETTCLWFGDGLWWSHQDIQLDSFTVYDVTLSVGM